MLIELTSEQLEHLPNDGGTDYNRLIFEKSPYLLQHAANPVDWFPWGDAAFEKARSEDKPVFLSIGYATCHWCHVMEHESFEDDAVAALMNASFVCVKVDREERPDIDQVYMAVTQAMSGHGGWPMTVLLTWEKKPFFTGTYFPKSGSYGRPGLMELLPALAEAWKNKRPEVLQSAQSIVEAFQKTNPSKTHATKLDTGLLESAGNMLKSQFDNRYAGFGRAPKFPTPQNLTFLLRLWNRNKNPDDLSMVERTLRAMRAGGIYDHVGFGFHRYATDEKWFLPHFEKMLYDQALISTAYIDCYRATHNHFYKKVAEEIFEYVLRDMTSPEGGFYSAEDADSEGVEGKFYLWTMDELTTILGEKDASIAAIFWNATPDGNYYEEATREFTGSNHFHRQNFDDVVAAKVGLSESELLSHIASIRTKLFAHRKTRIHPLKDDKILTDWNGLMISALAKGAFAFQNSTYADAAARAAEFIWTGLRTSEGRLVKRFRNGSAGLAAHIDDYAFMIQGFLALYEATFDGVHIERAIALQKVMDDLFWDNVLGGYFFTASDGEPLMIRPKELYDGAVPSGNSIAAINLLKLSAITGESGYRNKVQKIGDVFQESLNKAPAMFNQFLHAVDSAIGPGYEIIITGKTLRAVNSFLEALAGIYLPNVTILVVTPDSKIRDVAPWVKLYPDSAEVMAYCCSNFTCKNPVTTPSALLEQLRD